jgi:hypothetical protein
MFSKRCACTRCSIGVTRQDHATIVKTTFGGDFLPLSMHGESGLTADHLKNLAKNAPKKWDPSINDWVYQHMVHGGSSQ